MPLCAANFPGGYNIQAGAAKSFPGHHGCDGSFHCLPEPVWSQSCATARGRFDPQSRGLGTWRSQDCLRFLVCSNRSHGQLPGCAEVCVDLTLEPPYLRNTWNTATYERYIPSKGMLILSVCPQTSSFHEFLRSQLAMSENS
jgi:hypothetical protein